VTINVSNAPTITITVPATVQRGLPATFTFVVTAAATNGSPIRDISVNWGDGQSVNIGTFTGSQAAAHTYTSNGSFVITAVVTDVTGGTGRASSPVTVVPVAGTGVVVSAAPASGTVGTLFTFTVNITPPTGLGVVSASIDYGDGQIDQLGGATGAITRTHAYSAVGTKAVVVSVTDTSGRTNQGSTTVQIN